MPAAPSRHDHFPRADPARRAAIRAAVSALDAAWTAADTAPDGLLTAIDAQADAPADAAIAALLPWLTDPRWLTTRLADALALLRTDPFARPPLRAFGGGEGSGGDAAPGGLVLAERGHVRLSLRLWPAATRPPPAAPAIFVPGRAALHILVSGGAQLCEHRVAVSLNIMDEGDHVPWRDQYIVDLGQKADGRGTIAKRPTLTSSEMLLRCAVHLSDDAHDIAAHFAKAHPVPRVRANAIAALAAAAEGEGWAAVLERGLRDADARVRDDCARWLAE